MFFVERKLQKSWHVKLRSGEQGVEAPPVDMMFTDVRDIFDGWLVFKKVLFDKIVDAIKNKENYFAVQAIEEVNPPSEEISVLPEQCFIVIATDLEGNPYGFLFVVTAKGTVLAGIWPEPLAAAMKEKNDLLNAILYLLLEEPERWKEVIVVFVVKEMLEGSHDQ